MKLTDFVNTAMILIDELKNVITSDNISDITLIYNRKMSAMKNVYEFGKKNYWSISMGHVEGSMDDIIFHLLPDEDNSRYSLTKEAINEIGSGNYKTIRVNDFFKYT